MIIKVHVVSPKYTPEYKTVGSAGMDLRARVPGGSYVIAPNEIYKFDTGVFIELLTGYVGLMRPRSGLSLADIDSKAGTIDCDYRGEIGIIVKNNSGLPFPVRDGDRIAQLLIIACEQATMRFVGSVSELSETGRGHRGFGHTGLK